MLTIAVFYRCLLCEFNGTKQILLETLRSKEEMQTTINGFCKEKSALMDETALLQKKLDEKESLVLELKQLQDSSSMFAARNDALLKENASLKDTLRELESLECNIEAMENSLRLAKEIASPKKNNGVIKDPIYELEQISNEPTKLQVDITVANEKTQNQNDILVGKDTIRVDNSTEEMTELRNALRISHEEMLSLREINSSLENQVAQTEADLKEYSVLQSRFDVLKKETLILTKENAEGIKNLEFLSSEREILQKRLAVVSKAKQTLQESNSSLKDEIAKLKVHSENYECLKSHFEILEEEKLLMKEEIGNLKEKIKQTRSLSSESEALYQELNESNAVMEKPAEENTIAKHMKSRESSQNKKETISDKVAPNPSISLDNISNTLNKPTNETENHDLLMSRLGEIMQMYKHACKQDEQISVARDMAKIKGECLCHLNCIH